VALFASYRLYTWVPPRELLQVAGLSVKEGLIWAAAVFVAAELIISLFTFGPITGLQSVDGKTHKLIDLLIETEQELSKVSWPDREELTRSTTAVLISIVLLGAFLFAVDWVVTKVMGALEVLPT
jgi:preprotein translocase subunit SecE